MKATTTRVIFCEMGFWRRLEETLMTPVTAFCPEYQSVQNCKNLFDALCRVKVIHFDNSELFSDALSTEGVLFRLWKMSESEDSPEIDCSWVSDQDTNLEINNSILLSECINSNKSDGGMLELDFNTCKTNSYIYSDFGEALGKSSQISWDHLLKNAVHRCNAMVIFDHYLLNNKDKNLYKILDILLPERMANDLPFQISLFVSNKTPNLETEKNKIANEIRLKKPELIFELHLYSCGANDFHDRAILTNYIWIGSGGGFDLLERDTALHDKSTKTTTIPKLYPLIQKSTNWAIDAYDRFLLDAAKVRRIQALESVDHNRLIELACSK